jgi:hypothetical protein
MFGTYVSRGQLLVYPFYEYTVQRLEYKPAELGYGTSEDFRGRYRERESELFFGYGVTDRLALELEGALNTRATLRKAEGDPSSMPARIRETGLGDIQAEARWRWVFESRSRPEIFSYLETDFPFQRRRKLIGTQDWEYKLGTGLLKGFGFGTLAVRVAAEYHRDERTFEVGEYALEYLRRLSPAWRVYTGIEGTQDEIEYITEAQYRLGSHAYLKLNNSFGLTPKAPTWAPEIGVMLSF